MPTLIVGPGEESATISTAVAASQAGDTILVQAGTYTAPAESYCHDGSAGFFDSPPANDHVTSLPFAKTVTRGPIREGIWRQLLDWAGGPLAAHWTDDPDLHLLADGSAVAANDAKNGVHLFRVTNKPETAWQRIAPHCPRSSRIECRPKGIWHRDPKDSLSIRKRAD